MKYEIETVSGFLTNVLAGWKNVECVAVDQRSDTRPNHPYFALVLDVYHRGSIPPEARRQKAFGTPEGFETATDRSKDRFMLSDVPVRLEYKRVRRIDDMLKHPLDHIRLLKNSGTYPLYRIQASRILFGSSDWILRARAALDAFPEAAWHALYGSFAAKMEHYLEDMSAALVTGDPYFRIVSEAGFARFAAAALFMANHRFEPSHRQINADLRLLPLLPVDFVSLWDSFLKDDAEADPAWLFHLAEHMAAGILAL